MTATVEQANSGVPEGMRMPRMSGAQKVLEKAAADVGLTLGDLPQHQALVRALHWRLSEAAGQVAEEAGFCPEYDRLAGRMKLLTRDEVVRLSPGAAWDVVLHTGIGNVTVRVDGCRSVREARDAALAGTRDDITKRVTQAIIGTPDENGKVDASGLAEAVERILAHGYFDFSSATRVIA